MKHRIYSDFNGPYQTDFMLLTYIGTLKDLNAQKLKLQEGMEITVYSDSDKEEDLEIDGIVKYGKIPSTEKNIWYVDTRGNEVRYVKVTRDTKSAFSVLCFSCRKNIYKNLGQEKCPYCGFQIEYAWQPV